MIERLLKTRAYEERATHYISAFSRYVNSAETILDVGCGSGVFSKALVRDGRIVIAIDINKKLLRKLGDGGVERICADAHFLPLRSQIFDRVLSLADGAPSKA
jgi:ubiquinone/menaquinone biosynthesis C-methylase UbiE